MDLLSSLVGFVIGIDAVLVDELVPIYPDEVPRETIERLDVPRGARGGVHVVCHDLAGDEHVDVQVEGLTDLPARWYLLGDVPVEENTGPDSRTERWDKAQNPHVIRDAPFRVYDVLEPSPPSGMPEDGRVVMRLEIDTPPDAATGHRALVIRVRQGDQVVERPVLLVVHEATVRPIGPDALGYTNWFSIDEMASRHGLEPWSEDHWSMIRRYAELMAKGRQTMFWVTWPSFFEDVDGQWVLDVQRLRRFVEIFTDAGLYWIEGAPVARRPDGDWGRADLELRLGEVPLTGDTGRELFAHQAGQVYALIEAEGWQDRWVQHIADEPTDVNARDYALAADLMRNALPGVPIFEATMSRDLVDAVDMWCPQVQAWHAHRGFFDERQAAGDQVWVYTCLRPGGPWLNRLLDQERLRQVYFGWGAAHGGWDGYLHWGLNHYKADPFAQSVVDHPAMPGTDNRLPAGDTHVVYPGDDGPWSSVRFEAHRIGMEDHDLLTQHAGQFGARTASLIDEVYRAPDNWESDVARFRRTRRMLMEDLAVTKPQRIEVLGFGGCPMTPELLAAARKAAAQMSPERQVEYIDLETLADGDPLLRWPAPTLLIDGVDLMCQQPAAKPALACRIYPGGLPTAEEIHARLETRSHE